MKAEDSSEEEIASVDREEKPLPDYLPLSHGEEPLQDHERLARVVETSDEEGSSKADETTDESHRKKRLH
ncbi:hypothetical protein OS493_010229 [Desmophyllum pertusum]|uniref:Uncharacterized protein n=1 Tax=Desmophyllum pertusum TaxID=174260 RepID=A0A9X0DAB6_9CNID|nr:hypothetical protein OS493_010229 [Desmophyllum pertusum]